MNDASANKNAGNRSNQMKDIEKRNSEISKVDLSRFILHTREI